MFYFDYDLNTAMATSYGSICCVLSQAIDLFSLMDVYIRTCCPFIEHA